MSKDEVTVEELRAVVEYVRAWRRPSDLPAAVTRPGGSVSLSADLHHVPRAVLREVVADDPDAWAVKHYPHAEYGAYFAARLKGHQGVELCVFTKHEKPEQAAL